MSKVKLTRAKIFQFHRPDGTVVEIPVPQNWDQSLVPLVVRKDYAVNIVIASKAPAEADYGKIAPRDGRTGGYIIPGAAVLSQENPHSADSNYCAYNLLIADAICRASEHGNYELAAQGCQTATSRDQIFRQNSYYMVTWNKYFTSPSKITTDFALSLCDHGLVFSVTDENPIQLYTDYEGNGALLKLKPTPNLPAYIINILGSLVPYCANPFLRFFYLYQVVEYLMGVELDTKVSDVRARFSENLNPSVVELREILEKFQDATREKTRIKTALLPACPNTAISAESLLTTLNALDPETSFAERIYRVRNILFHDYKQLHGKEAGIAVLCQNFFAYLVGKKFLA